uniref:Thiamine pyrophosphokinase n=1 Tax=Eptatretus burgeri TaxID=7764 RepID=A0A8C4QN81_EPTBU
MDIEPLNCLLPQGKDKVALMILNQPLSSMECIKILWQKAVIKVCVDGGANRLHDLAGSERERFIPDFISGDLDSAFPTVLEFYKNKGSDIIHTPDQDYTDFTKSTQLLLGKLLEKKEQVDIILAVGGLGGRFDQIMASIETLCHMQTADAPPIIVIQQNSLACLLLPGSHTLSVNTGIEKGWCGLIPIDGSCDHVTTSGLKWNLVDQRLQFGVLVSTSNTLDGSGIVHVTTDAPLLWTMGLKNAV